MTETEEKRTFIENGNSVANVKKSEKSSVMAMILKVCIPLSLLLGSCLLIVGLAALLMGSSVLESKILASMALSPNSERFQSWLTPPVQPHLYAYVFHVTNPDAILRGGKPIVEERGPYVYKSTTVKDSDDTLEWSEDLAKITYRPRKVYQYVPSLSGAGLDPNTDYVTVPNIPLWTGLNKVKFENGGSALATGFVTGTGRGTPFVNITFDGLLWGYEDELPCLKLDAPPECDKGDTPFSSSSSDFGDDEDDDFGDDFDFKRRKRRSTDDVSIRVKRSSRRNPDKDPNSPYYGLAKPKAEFVDCKCNWGLFRDRNITMRKPLEFYSGLHDLGKKGIVTKFDDDTKLNWWRPGSQCDAVKGQDASTLPPGLTEDDSLEVFIPLMCRSLKMKFEKEVEHADIRSLRFIPPSNALGAHDDDNEERRNEDNECYCLKEERFDCFKSGVLNMQPCKRELQAPLALSMPHFYQADPSFLENVGGLKPEKELHQFFVDVVPEFGFPLAIRPRFQLNVVIGSGVNSWSPIQGMREQIVLPFLWAQDGFDEPSDEMAEKIRFGLDAPQKLPMLVALIAFVLGAIFVLTGVGLLIWNRRSTARSSNINTVST